MGVVLNRLLQTIRFDRDAFVWMEFNDRATGDALIIVAVTEVLFIIAGGTPLLLDWMPLIRNDAPSGWLMLRARLRDHTTSSDVMSLPSWNTTPSRRLNV